MSKPAHKKAAARQRAAAKRGQRKVTSRQQARVARRADIGQKKGPPVKHIGHHQEEPVQPDQPIEQQAA